ncbi:ATP-grasp domain-containing protein [Dactylosporangium roseum]|uniref:ATP-grasp domain-containing protein n=1 Tax=Dactylosporangium roseum TaxID=47989 RepID=A0ABY5ZF50_9ACTN|nr:ATP-grasp domain-containing protein [Dactylosporangium roseum]UWZ39585.1 ATP-grasp domain-containing protein [Dactylosporangium roseum]
MHDTRPLLILVASGMRVYREYLLRSIARDFRVHLFHTAEPQWERAYLDGWTVLPSTIDGPAMAQSALHLAKRQPVAGVLCWDEGRILAASHIAEALGLPGGDPAVVWRMRDKAQTRQACARAGVPQPRSRAVRTLEEALAAAEGIGYPVVLKPRGLGASLGVVRVEDPDGLRRHFAFTRDTKAPDPVLYASDHPVLVEECVVGEEISIDAVVRGGVVTPLFVARKVVGYPPYAEEVGHCVDANDPLLTDPALTSALRQTHLALGVLDAWTHTEFMLTADGPRLIEVNGRLGGDLIPYLGSLATGLDPGLLAAATACGRTAPIRPDRARAAAVRFFYVEDEDTTITSIAFDGDRLPSTVDLAVAVALPGAVVSPPPKGTVWGRVAFATAAAGTPTACAEALDAAAAALHIT